MKKSIFLSLSLVLAVSLILLSFRLHPKHFPYILSDHYTRVNDYPELLLQAQSLPAFGLSCKAPKIILED